jgi:hypothetical protein
MQRPALTLPLAATFGQFVAMGDPGAYAYIVGGFRDKSEGPWRWTHDHPVLQFWLPPQARVRFTAEFSFPEQTFSQTGPVTLTFAINGKVFDRVRYAQPGTEKYNRPVPPDLLNPGVNTVAIDPDKCATRPEGGERLGFVLLSAGFAE